jgi:hypothetical protein
LNQGSQTGDRAAFRLSRKVRAFKARTPKGIVIVDDNALERLDIYKDINLIDITF